MAEECWCCMGEKTLPAVVIVEGDIMISEVRDVPCPICCAEPEAESN
jgi:hypothetical protein